MASKEQMAHLARIQLINYKLKEERKGLLSPQPNINESIQRIDSQATKKNMKDAKYLVWICGECDAESTSKIWIRKDNQQVVTCQCCKKQELLENMEWEQEEQ